MRSDARVVVIGGGVVGASVLYHLTKLGWSDVVLLERSELTSGSTWHAAGGMHTLNSDPNVARLQDYTIRLYAEIEKVSGQSCGLHLTGGIMLATDRDRLDWLKSARARARLLGMELEFISLEEVKKRHPLIDTTHFLGALYDPHEGHVDPSGVTQAYARAARLAGAEVLTHTPVTETRQRPDGSWEVVTPKGTIRAEFLVNAAGLWAREVAALAGVHLPVLAMEHQYLLTEDLPQLDGLAQELPHVIDFTGEAYLRQEGRGLLLGTYEQACVPWSAERTPADFGHELLQPDLDRIAPSLEIAFRHVPVLAEAGIKRVINGPFTFAPDGNPLVGPVPGLRNYFVAVGVMAGFSQGGGVGLTLAEWMVEGEPSSDVWAMDVARYGDWATKAFTFAKVQENYRRRFSIVFPNEELPAGRPLRSTAAYDRLRAAGAVFGASYGLEHALWFSPEGPGRSEAPTFRRSEAFDPVGEECRAVREAAGLAEIATYAKYRIEGPGAEAWLGRLLAGRLPAEGRIVLTPMLNARGRLIGDFTLARLGAESFLLVGSGAAERYHLRWFRKHLPDDGSVRLENLCSRLHGFSVAGPESRAILQRTTALDLSAGAFPFLSVAATDVGLVPATVARISFTGELGYEIYVAPEYQAQLFDTLTEAGRDRGLRLFGARALDSLRLEKAFGAWTREYTPDYTPAEAGLDRFVSKRRQDFVGAGAGGAPQRRLVALAVEAADADAAADDPVWHGDRLAGFVTSGGWGHTIGQSLALAYLDSEAAQREEGFMVEILGEKRPARRLGEPPVDPEGLRMRS